MRQRLILPAATFSALVTAALTVPPATAQPNGSNWRRMLASETRQELERPLVLVTTGDVLGADVVNRGEHVGTLRDLVVDRLTGQAVYGIVSIDIASTEGEGDLAVPYDLLAWHSGQRAFLSDLDSEHLRGMQVFSRERLQELAPVGDRTGRPAEASSSRRDILSSFFEVRMQERIIGKVDSVASWSHESLRDGHGEYLALLVEVTGEDSLTRVLLGPSSFVGEPLFGRLAKGTPIALEGVPGDDDDGDLFVATDLELEDVQLELRNQVGAPLWDPVHYAVASELGARTVVVGEEELGSPEAVVLDARTGQVVFFTAAIEAETCPIPMRAVMVCGNNRLRVNGVTREALVSAPHLLGDDFLELNDPTLRAAVYQFFGVDAGSVLPRRS